MIILSWQTGVARARFEGHVRYLAQVVSAEAYALHHYIYQTGLSADCTISSGSQSCGRSLTTSQWGEVTQHHTRVPWRRYRGFWSSEYDSGSFFLLPRGWSIGYLVGDTTDSVRDPNTGESLLEGVVYLLPSDDIVNSPVWSRIISAVNEKISSRKASNETDVALLIAENALSDFDRTRDTAVLASHFSRLDNNALLKSPHPGHPILPMQTSINMNDNFIVNIDTLHVRELDIDFMQAYPNWTPTEKMDIHTNNIKITGDLIIKVPDPTDSRQWYLDDPNTDTEAPLLAHSLTVLSPPCNQNNPPCESSKVTVTDDVTVTGSIHANDIEISGTSTLAKITACVDPQKDLCDGGELEILDLKDGSSLSNVQVFATTTVDPSVIDPPSTEDSTITTIRALTGVIDEIEQGQMTVSGCFRSVTPYAYGARC